MITAALLNVMPFLVIDILGTPVASVIFLKPSKSIELTSKIDIFYKVNAIMEHDILQSFVMTDYRHVIHKEIHYNSLIMCIKSANLIAPSN